MKKIEDMDIYERADFCQKKIKKLEELGYIEQKLLKSDGMDGLIDKIDKKEKKREY